MDTKKYEAMILSAEKGSFTRAADFLGYTQSGMTHMMNALEAEVGFQLLKRGHFGIRLTPEGERLLPAIKAFLKAGDALNEEIHAINELASESITIGTYSSVANHWLPSILNAFRQVCPKVQVHVHDESRSELFADVQNGRFDLAFTSKPREENVEWHPLHDDELLALLPKSACPPEKQSFRVEDYSGMQFLMPAFGYEADILAVLNAYQVQPEIMNTSVGDPAIISMVAHGLGVSMLSELCVKGYEESVCLLPLSPRQFRTLGIITRKNMIMKPVVSKLIECARMTVAQMYSSDLTP